MNPPSLAVAVEQIQDLARTHIALIEQKKSSLGLLMTIIHIYLYFPNYHIVLVYIIIFFKLGLAFILTDDWLAINYDPYYQNHTK